MNNRLESLTPTEPFRACSSIPNLFKKPRLPWVQRISSLIPSEPEFVVFVALDPEGTLRVCEFSCS